MSAVLQKSSHSAATDMIRADHSRVIMAFHRYESSARSSVRRALVESISLALEMHAELEEEMLYPAARDAREPTVDKNVLEHAEMKRLITTLRSFDPDDAQFEPAFMELMALVMHHAADEETRILPAVDSLPRDTLRELSARMWRRRSELMMQNFGAIASNKVRAAPGTFGAILAGVGIAAVAIVSLARKHDRS
jgi:hemerythrin superfamily protein